MKVASMNQKKRFMQRILPESINTRKPKTLGCESFHYRRRAADNCVGNQFAGDWRQQNTVAVMSGRVEQPLDIAAALHGQIVLSARPQPCPRIYQGQIAQARRDLQSVLGDRVNS